jgi:hypothetical protein
MATTAVVAGTAANMGARSAQRNAATTAPVPAPEAAPGAPATADDANIEEIRKLAALKDEGLLTEEEFAAKKAKVLGI